MRVNLKCKPLSWLPNQAGFKFIGIQHDGTEVPCEVVMNGHLHTVSDGMFSKLKGWRDK